MRKLSAKEHIVNWLCFLVFVPVYVYALYLIAFIGLLAVFG